MSKKRKYFATSWQRLLAIFLLLGFIIQPLSAIGFAEEQDTDPPRISTRSVDDVSPPKRVASTEDERDTDPPRIYGEQDTDPSRLSLGASGEVEEEPAPTYIEEFEISTAKELLALAQRVNGGDRMKDMLVTLTADIELDPETFWTPIGNAVTTPFAGTFDGGDHYISGIRIWKDEEDNYANGGLFGYLYEATVKSVYLKDADAPNSTGGLYFSAARSTITDCKKKWGPFALFSTGISLFAARVFAPAWDGTADPGLITSASVVKITTAEELAQVAALCNAGLEDFDGKIVLLCANLDLNGASHNWTPIGTSTDLFRGQFHGQGYVIKDMTVNGTEGGLFGFIDAGTSTDGMVTNLIIDNADVTATAGNTGIVAGTSYASSISSIVVKDSRVSAPDASGICDFLSMQDKAFVDRSAAISQCLVIDTDITATSIASGICRLNENYSVSQCAVYRGTLDGSMAMNGIVDESFEWSSAFSYSGVSQNLVLGTRFIGGGNASGIMSNITSSTFNSVGDSFVSDVDMAVVPNNVLGTYGTPYGVERILTDSRLDLDLVDTAAIEHVRGCVWDASTAPASRSPLPKTYPDPNGGPDPINTGHAVYKTGYLTSGSWLPDETFWTARKDYYPHLKYLARSQTPYVKDITGLAAVAVLLDNPEETLDDAKEMRLVKKTATGANVKWYADSSLTPIESDNRFEVEDDGDSLILWTRNDITFDLRAVANTTEQFYDNEEIYKDFPNLTLKDVILEEDTTERHPSAAESATPLPTAFIPSLTFLEPIRINPAAREMIRLYTIRSSGTFLDKALPCDSANIALLPPSGTNYKVEFQTLGLRNDMRYRLVIPAGALEEEDGFGTPKGNYSEEIVFEFDTETILSPVLNVPATINLQADSPLSLSDVEGWFQYSQYNDSPVKNQLTTPVTDPRDTLDNLPVGLHYYIDPAMLGSSRSPGISIVHYFAVTSKGATARATTVIEVDGPPQWDPEALPPTVLHTNWTNNQNAITALILEKSRAFYTTARNSRRDVAIECEIDASDWTAAMAKHDGPSSVKVTTHMLDTQGNRIAGDTKETLVYMDKVLKYSFNTGAIVIPWEDRSFSEWEKIIAEEINFVALNFGDTADIKYDHGKNDYNENKVYTVKLTTAKQHVTMCDGEHSGPYPCPLSDHQHLKDKIALSFSIRIKEADLPEERNFWEKVENELFDPDYSEFNVTAVRKPQLKIPDKDPHIDADDFFEMPISILEALRVQPYNSLELDYSAFKWKLYGHALEPVDENQRFFPLKVRKENIKDYVLGRKLGKDIPAVMLKFDYIGHLHGRVEFFYDLRLAGDLSKEQIADTDFYLYRVNKLTGNLTPVADVRVEEDGWASMVLTQLEDSEYVITDSRFGGEKYKRYVGYGADDDEPEERYYHGVNNYAANLDMFEQNPPEGEEIDPALPFAPIETEEMTSPPDPSAMEASSSGSSDANHSLALVIAAAIGILLAGAAIIIVKLKKGKGA